MKKTNNFFVISNFNTDPEQYLEYCEDYHIYDQSTDFEIKMKLQKKYKKISFVENTGHNISDYFRFFIDHYDSLPNLMLLAKGNMIGRHVTKEYFDRVYNNDFYTFLQNDREWKDREGVAYSLYDGAFLEKNNSWYKDIKSHRYFKTYNELLSFIFVNPVISPWILFCPGACHIVTKEQILRYPKEFYKNLQYLMSYVYFPSEAYHVERMLNVIFNANYEIHGHMKNSSLFYQELLNCELKNKLAVSKGNIFMGFIRAFSIFKN